MQQINNSVKSIFDNVNKRKADPTRKELFGQQITTYLKECTNNAKKNYEHCIHYDGGGR
jgi:hypothetical protein